MQLTEMKYSGPVPVDGYGPGFFRVGGEVYQGPVLLFPDGISAWSGLNDLDALVRAKDMIDVVFLGMGADIAALTASQRALFDTAGLGVEVMSSPAACRTYNVLIAEGRRIAAGLIPV